MSPSAARARLRGVLRRVSRRLVRRPPAPRPQPAVEAPAEPPTISVVIPVYNVEKYIDACLTSLRAQTHRQLQIIIVDDGSTDGSADIYRRHAAEDDRILVLRQENAGQGAARNRGLLEATGHYLTFLDPDDLLPYNAYATLCTGLERSGSDFAVGSILRMSHGAFSSTSWINVAHARDRIGITIDDFPEAVMDVICCNRLLRRSFWEEAQIRFPEGVAYEDHVPMMQAFVRAERFDVLHAVTYYWRTREDFTSTGQRKREVQNLRDRVAAKEQAAELLKDSSLRVRQAWLRRVLDIDLYGFLRQLEWADDEYWEVLGAAVRRFLGEADSEVLDHVRVSRKVQAWLLAQHRREQLLSLLRWQRENPRDLPTEVRGGRVLACFPPLLDPDGLAETGTIPEQVLSLTEDETRLSVSLRGASVVDDGILVLEGWAHPRLVNLHGQSLQIEAAMVEDQLGLRYLVPVELRDVPEADSVREHAHQSYRSSGFSARIDLEELARRVTAAQLSEPAKSRLAAWRLELTGSVAGIVRTAQVRSRDTRSSAGELGSVRLSNGLAVVPIMDRADGLRIEVRRPRAVLTSLSATGRRVSGIVRLPVAADAARPRLRLEVRSATGHTATADLNSGADGEAAFALELPDLRDDEWNQTPQERRLWTMHVLIGRRTERLAWSPDEAREWWPAADGAEIVAQCTERGHVNLTETSDVAVVEDVVLGEDQVVVRGRWLGPVTRGWEPQLRPQHLVGAANWTARSVQTDGPAFECVFDVSVDPWGRGQRPPQSGDYLLQFLRSDGVLLRPRMTRTLVERTVLQHHTTRYGLRLRRGGGRQVLLTVTPPLQPDEQSAFGQRLLRERVLATSPELVAGSVLMQVGDGEHAGDSPLALARELQARRRDTRIAWSVADHSREVPEGAQPVVIGTADWHETWARAEHVVLAGDAGPSPAPRPQQQVLQTFRGYPCEPTRGARGLRRGHASTEGGQLPEAAQRWTMVLGQDQHATEKTDPAVRIYGWEGPRIDVGWPRQDLLTEGDVNARRDLTRRQLGLAESVALLWAPAWRRTAGQWEPAPGPLGLGSVLSALPAHVVVLLCGDVLRGRARSGKVRVVDLRWYPRLDELVLASDVAATGTASLADDYAVTGRPQLRLTATTRVEDVLELVDRAGSGTGIRARRPRPSAAVVEALWPRAT